MIIMVTPLMLAYLLLHVSLLFSEGDVINVFFQLLGNWEAQMRRIMKMIAGGGLSITGSHTMCGDYLYSGHTVMLTLTYLFIKECKFFFFQICIQVLYAQLHNT